MNWANSLIENKQKYQVRSENNTKKKHNPNIITESEERKAQIHDADATAGCVLKVS